MPPSTWLSDSQDDFFEQLLVTDIDYGYQMTVFTLGSVGARKHFGSDCNFGRRFNPLEKDVPMAHAVLRASVGEG